jgi:hypothetical protein
VTSSLVYTVLLPVLLLFFYHAVVIMRLRPSQRKHWRKESPLFPLHVKVRQPRSRADPL